MPHNCHCPLCGQDIKAPPAAILPERGMVVANGRFAVLTGHEMVLLHRLVEVFPGILSKEAALEWLYSLAPGNEPEAQIVDVYICHIRKKIKPLGLRIDTSWGRGYSLSAETPLKVIKEDGV